MWHLMWAFDNLGGDIPVRRAVRKAGGYARFVGQVLRGWETAGWGKTVLGTRMPLLQLRGAMPATLLALSLVIRALNMTNGGGMLSNDRRRTGHLHVLPHMGRPRLTARGLP